MSGRGNRVPLKFKSINDLKPLYNNVKLDKMDPRNLLKKLDQIFETAQDRMNKGDIEQAYVLIMKYLSVVSYIQKSSDYAKDPTYYKAMMGKKPKEALELAEVLHESLEEGYKDLENYKKENEENKENAIVGSVNVVTIEEPPDMREKKESKSTMTSATLFHMLKDGVTKVLVMDARPSHDYQESRIQDATMINIPDEILETGQSANMIERRLSLNSQNFFKNRGNYDQIVLLDWETKEKDFVQSKLNILKDILTKWDYDTKYKNEILILDGGYNDWLDTYPWCTTKPAKTRHRQDHYFADAKLDSVVYPNLDELGIEGENLKPFFDRSKKPLKRALNDIDYTASDELLVEKRDEGTRPSFDRAKKAAAIQTYEQRKAETEELLNQTFVETSEAVELEQTRVENERELAEIIRRQKEMEADDEQKKILAEAEEKVYLKMKQLEDVAAAKDETIKELQEALEAYRKKDEEEKAKIIQNEEGRAKKLEMEEREKKEDEMREKIRLQELEKERLAKEREEMERKLELDEKYREKLEIARLTKKKLYENKENDLAMEVNEAARIPYVNRANKPRIVEKIRRFNGVKGNVGRGLTGLKNLGNTCYMNSILQCISNNSAMCKYFYDGHYKGDLNRFSKTRGEIAEELAALVKELWSGLYKSIACQDFRYTVGMYKPEYATYEQQDSHEFLTFVLDWLHNDLNKVRNPSAIEEENPGNDSEKAWRNFERKNSSLISTLFYGLQKSTVTCLKCGEKSVTFEPFCNLSLIIPEHDHCNLEQCLRLYLKSERISGWRCPKCKDLREADKKTDLCRLPQILVIHLKRFHYIEILSRKRTSWVDFPLSNLNMMQFAPYNTKNTNYDLYAVSNHYGTMEGGHYTAFCKNPFYRKWYKFDDHEITEMYPNEVKSNAAYILFYASSNSHS